MVLEQTVLQGPQVTGYVSEADALFRRQLDMYFDLFRASTRPGGRLSMRISTQGFVAICNHLGDILVDVDDDQLEDAIADLRVGLRTSEIHEALYPAISAVYGRFSAKYGKVNGYRLELFHDGSGCVRNPRGQEVVDFEDTEEAVRFI